MFFTFSFYRIAVFCGVLSSAVLLSFLLPHRSLAQSVPRINDLRIEDGELRWTAPANVSRYSIRFYTGEITSRTAIFSGCSYDYSQENAPNGRNYCVGEAISVTRSQGETERLRIEQTPTKSFVVTYDDGRGGRSEVSNVAVWKIGSPSIPPSPVTPPPAGYEDEVLTNIDTYRNPFPDTSLKTLGGKAAAELYRRAIIGGFPDGQFKGDRPVNRAEAAKFLILASIHKDDVLPELMNGGRFPDVFDGQWYTKYVIGAANLGIISGHPDGTFRPADTVNTAEFLKMLTLTFGLRQHQTYRFTDVSATAWYASYAGIAQQYSLFPNRTTRLYPERALTREEVAVAIYQYLSRR